MRGSIIAAVAVLSSWPALAAPDLAIRESVAVCDPYNPTNCLAPNASGGLPGGTGGGGSGVSLPQGVTMSVTNPTVAAATATTLRSQNNNRKYLQMVNETGGDCRFSYGSVVPSASSGMLLTNRGQSTLEASAITFQPVTIWCVQAGMIDLTEGQ